MSVRFESPIIYLITAGEATDSNFASELQKILDICRLAVESGVSLIQIREKQLSGRNLFVLTSAMAEITRDSAARLLVNDRPDIAMAAGADGVHLALGSLPAGVVRSSFPKDFVIGVSAHSEEDVSIAAENGADFVVYGPIFETPGKGRPIGLDRLRTVCDRVDTIPILGLGGVDEANCLSVVDAGAKGIAAIRSLNEPASMVNICRILSNGRN